MTGTLGTVRNSGRGLEGKPGTLDFCRHRGNKSQIPLAGQAWYWCWHSKCCVSRCTNQLYRESLYRLGVSLVRKERITLQCLPGWGGDASGEGILRSSLLSTVGRCYGRAQQSTLAGFEGGREGFPEEMTSNTWTINCRVGRRGRTRRDDNDYWDRHRIRRRSICQEGVEEKERLLANGCVCLFSPCWHLPSWW